MADTITLFRNSCYKTYDVLNGTLMNERDATPGEILDLKNRAKALREQRDAIDHPSLEGE